MLKKPPVEIQVARIVMIEVSPDGRDPAIISLRTADKDEVRLVLPTVPLVELEALLAKASYKQAERQLKQ